MSSPVKVVLVTAVAIIVVVAVLSAVKHYACSTFEATSPLGEATEFQKALLESEAPETLKEPVREDFSCTEAYVEAVRKWNLYGNWASL